ncbi:MAG: DNA mismatch repair endonuclease MutL [Candidatus Woesearchaeota archaeon]
MGNIILLDERLVNKIAAGEVVERPASVVKELVENAIDAGATEIKVEVEGFGKKLIKVKDNGSGMSGEDAKLALMRHSTSKIRKAEDLFAIKTLGFRGEALASIAAVSMLTLTTKEKNGVKGYTIEVEGGKITYSNTVGCSHGTTIEVKDLFFNTPARLKFMKSDSNELKHIIDVVTNYALLYSDLSFSLVHEGHVLVEAPPNSDMLQNIAAIYGGDVAKQMIKIEHEGKGVKIKGYISKPSLLKGDKSYQSIYVNGRCVKEEAIADAIYDAYHTLLFVNRHPVVVLEISLDASKVDVNVHPTKDRIKIERSSLVYEVVFNALRDALKGNELIPEHSAESQSALSKPLSLKKPDLAKPYPERKERPLLRDKQAFFSKEKSESRKFSKLPKMKLIGCIGKTYFIAETPEGMALIDQHVVWERVLYERFMAEFMGKKVKKQGLLTPKLMPLKAAEAVVLKENLEKIRGMGFDIEHFGDNTFRIGAMPMVFGKGLPDELVKDIISEISSRKSSFEKMQESIIIRMACRASVKAGDYVSIPQMEKMLEELDATELPYTCPHGRPIIVKFSYSEIEKMFKRR